VDIRDAICEVVEGRDLSGAQMGAAMTAIMTGAATPAQIAGFLVALRMKGETVDEIAAAAEVMRRLATPVRTPFDDLLDVVGTGGDAAATFNISTACAFVVAGAGARVAKHGNRAVSSRSGSADVLERLGVAVELAPEQVARCIAEVGVGFMFAPRHHVAMRHASGPRRELALRTLFNLLGPLTNPAGARHLLLGVFDARWLEPLARVATRLGARRVLVVHAEDGLDEISIGAPTRVAESGADGVRLYTITPAQFGFTPAERTTLCVADAEQSRVRLLEVLAGAGGPARDVVLLNAGAALYAAGLAQDIGAGIERARTAIDSGAAQRKLDALVTLSRTLQEPAT